LQKLEHLWYALNVTIGKWFNESISTVSGGLGLKSGVPANMQIVAQVEAAIRLGCLHVGDSLPRAKDTASTLAINPNTVLKAFQELEIRGNNRCRPSKGTFNAVAPPTLSTESQSQSSVKLIQ
jgi:DNA-binding transcriptional regulator YhcF (GntR family)